MKIELEQTMTDEDLGPTMCAICGDEFEFGPVSAWGYTDTNAFLGVDSYVCEQCIEVLGEYRPDRFPTIEEYRTLEAEWKTPLYRTGEEADAAFRAEMEAEEAEESASA